MLLLESPSATAGLFGRMGLRSEELRTLTRGAIAPARSDGITPWLHVHGKGSKRRRLPIPGDVERALVDWTQERDKLLDDGQPLFGRLGRRRRDGRFPDAGGQLSGRGLRDVVRPLMAAASVPAELCHPHVLRHTYGSLYMRRPGARLEDLRILMGHASIDTTSVYVHRTRDDLERAVLESDGHANDVLALSARRRERQTSRRRAA